MSCFNKSKNSTFGSIFSLKRWFAEKISTFVVFGWYDITKRLNVVSIETLNIAICNQNWVFEGVFRVIDGVENI